MPQARQKFTVLERFWKKVNKTASCWIWTGCRTLAGYGHIRLHGRKSPMVYAHRFSYESTFGSIPDGKELDHLCRNTLCVNPNHLEPVSHRQNMLRGNTFGSLNAMKTHCPNGHAYEGENLIVDGAKRKCRLCVRARRMAKHWLKTKSEEYCHRLIDRAQSSLIATFMNKRLGRRVS